MGTNRGLLLLLLFMLVGWSSAACPNNCHWNGRCHNNQCSCFHGFYGTDCHGDCGCDGHGVCNSDNTCKCDEGWKWDSGSNKCVWDCHCTNGASCIGPGECGCKPDCKSGDCRQAQCVCWEGFKGDDCSTLDKNIMMNKDVNVGMNLGGIAYYSSEVKFVDIAKQSQAWITERDGNSAWDTQEQSKVHWRPDGYPARLDDNMKLLKLMYRDYGAHEENGDYTVLYEGDGDLDFSLTSHHIKYDGKGRMVVNFDHLGSGGILMILRNVNPANPVRNIRVLAPGYENLYQRFPFHPVFLENLRRYSELRFMDFISTNAHKPEPTTWASRRLPDYHTQEGSEGGAIEYMVKLANILGANPWFNIPHAADDDYVRHFAQMVKKDLRPDLKVYLEYSNEVWNGIFRQTHYTSEEGLKLHLDPQGWKAGMKYYNKRSSEVMDIWKQVYGSSSDKLYPVWAWQTGYEDYTRQALVDLGDNIHKFKAIAITGYDDCTDIAGKHSDDLLRLSMAQLQDYCVQRLNGSRASFKHYIDVAKQHGVQLVMYEGGPSIMEGSAIAQGTSHDDVTKKAIAFNKDDHMEPFVSGLLEAWQSIVAQDSSNGMPGGLFNYFSYTGSPSKYGSWGMLEYTGQDPATVPKSRAVQKFITKHFPGNPLGPRCSFLMDGAIAYGCFHVKGGNFQCGSSDDHGKTWNYFHDPMQVHGADFLILDGYDPTTHRVFSRHVDGNGSTMYHIFDTQAKQWSSPVNFDYYTALSGTKVLPRFPNGVYHGLDAHAQCS